MTENEKIHTTLAKGVLYTLMIFSWAIPWLNKQRTVHISYDNKCRKCTLMWPTAVLNVHNISSFGIMWQSWQDCQLSLSWHFIMSFEGLVPGKHGTVNVIRGTVIVWCYQKTGHEEIQKIHKASQGGMRRGNGSDEESSGSTAGNMKVWE